MRPGSSPDRALVAVEVEEQPTGSLSLGGAFSSSEGLSAQISLTERNFLGRGQTLSGAISGSTEFSNYQLGFFEPALFDRDLLVGFTAYYRDSNLEEQSWETTNIGFEPRIGFPLSENGRLQLRYQLSSDEIRDVSEDTSLIIINEEGKQITSAIGLTYTYDRRNSVVDPTAGFILTASQDLAGLGGDVQYTKTEGTARAYTSLFDEDLVLSAELEGGYIYANDGTRITDRFNTGGDSFRGFARNGLGPRDFCGDTGEVTCLPPQQDEEVNDALGGNIFSVLRLDASFPLGLPEEYGIFGGVFADVGSLWQLDDINGSMGQVDDKFHLRSVGRREPLRRHAAGAAQVQLRDPDPVRGLRRHRALPLLGADPVLTGGIRPASARAGACRPRSPRRAGRRRRSSVRRRSSTSTRRPS